LITLIDIVERNIALATISKTRAGRIHELTRRQGDTLVFLASNHPSIVGEVARGTGQYYPNAWHNVAFLEKSGLVRKTGVRKSRFAEYWVTPKGAGLALDQGLAPNAIAKAIPIESINTYPFDLVRVLCETIQGWGAENYQRMTKADLLIVLGRMNLKAQHAILRDLVRLFKRMST
jgi:DNA-binding MarR family transcriptional regulator